jgi:hypothetical protein
MVPHTHGSYGAAPPRKMFQPATAPVRRPAPAPAGLARRPLGTLPFSNRPPSLSSIYKPSHAFPFFLLRLCLGSFLNRGSRDGLHSYPLDGPPPSVAAQRIPMGAAVTAVAFSPDGGYVAAALAVCGTPVSFFSLPPPFPLPRATGPFLLVFTLFFTFY